MNKIFRNIVGITVSVLIIAVAAALLFHRILYRSLPEYEGEISLKGISSNAEIFRDNYAIPYIFASSDEDAAFALGYVHAQERLFQMDMMRRSAQGRLSEVFGSQTIPYDVMFRTIGLARTVRRELSLLDNSEMVMLQAYSKGVNSYIQEAKGKYPIEFDALGYEPEEWKPEHSLQIGKMMAWQMNISWWTDISFAHLIERLGEDRVRQIIPDYPDNAPTIIPHAASGTKGSAAGTDESKSTQSGSTGGNVTHLRKDGALLKKGSLIEQSLNEKSRGEKSLIEEIGLGLLQTDMACRQFTGYTGTHIGSNNWAVSPRRSSSGKPIIANDPHLPFQAPCNWYAAVIRGSNWSAEGLTVPGIPAVIIGKSKNISWVVTNVMADDADFYIEKIDSLGRNYFYNGEWRPLKKYSYTIAVKDSEAVHITVRETHRGPIVSGVHLYNNFFKRRVESRYQLSMRWTGNDPSASFSAIRKLNYASDWNSFKNALKSYAVPGQNFVYADKAGNIGYVCAARLPIRQNVSRTFIADGQTDQYDWKGYVPYEQMPALFNPDSGYIASANNKTVKDFSYYISNIWEPSSRIERITEMLRGKNKHSVHDFEHYQMDFISPYARQTVPYILDAFKNVKIKDSNLKTALYLLKNWNFEMYEYSQVPAIYEVFFQNLLKNTFYDEMGYTLYNEFTFVANVPYRTMQKMLEENNSPWFDNIKTKKTEGRDDIIRQSMAQTLSFLESRFGKNPTDWQWSKLHTITFRHTFSGRYSFLERLINIGPYGIGGSGTTVFNSEYFFFRPYESVLGPSMRYIFDFADPDEFQMILTTGQSGNVLSDHYKDMAEMWLSGKYVSVKTNPAHIRNSNYKRLLLKPGNE